MLSKYRRGGAGGGSGGGGPRQSGYDRSKFVKINNVANNNNNNAMMMGMTSGGGGPGADSGANPFQPPQPTPFTMGGGGPPSNVNKYKYVAPGFQQQQQHQPQ